MKKFYQLKFPKKYDGKTKRQKIEEETGRKMTDLEWRECSQMLIRKSKS